MEKLRIAFYAAGGLFIILFIRTAIVNIRKENIKKRIQEEEKKRIENFDIKNYIAIEPSELAKWKALSVEIPGVRYSSYVADLDTRLFDIFKEVTARFFYDGSVSLLFDSTYPESINLYKLSKFVDDIALYQDTPSFERWGENDSFLIKKEEYWIGRRLMGNSKKKPMPDVAISMSEGIMELSILGYK